jgi:chromate transporter
MTDSDAHGGDNAPESAQHKPASPVELFVAFTMLALQGFGGVIAIAQRVLVERKRWLNREQFIEILSLAQVLPGPNVCNVALIIGDRFFGWRGAFAALGGMMAIPMVIVLAVAALYAQFAAEPVVAGAFRGMSAVAAGLILGTALKLASALGSNPMGVRVCFLAGATVFAAVALLRLPLVLVLLVVGSLTCAFAWSRLRASDSGGN